MCERNRDDLLWKSCFSWNIWLWFGLRLHLRAQNKQRGESTWRACLNCMLKETNKTKPQHPGHVVSFIAPLRCEWKWNLFNGGKHSEIDSCLVLNQGRKCVTKSYRTVSYSLSLHHLLTFNKHHKTHQQSGPTLRTSSLQQLMLHEFSGSSEMNAHSLLV